MSRLLLTSDLHLGHKNILKFRGGFKSQEEHDETLFDNLATTLNKRDSIIFLGDIAFNLHWLTKIAGLKCAKKTLILGNHDLERGVTMRQLTLTYDRIESLMSKRGAYFSHCPIHPSQFRGNKYNIHGHLHNGVIRDRGALLIYINVCVEHTDWKPITFSDAINK